MHTLVSKATLNQAAVGLCNVGWNNYFFPSEFKSITVFCTPRATSLSITLPVTCPVMFCSSAKLYAILCLPGSHLAHPEASVSSHPRWHPPRLQKARLQLCSIWNPTELSISNPCDFYRERKKTQK